MIRSNMRDFHVPFIQGLVVVGLVTIVSMISARYLVEYSLSNHLSTPVYTSQEFQSQAK